MSAAPPIASIADAPQQNVGTGHFETFRPDWPGVKRFPCNLETRYPDAGTTIEPKQRGGSSMRRRDFIAAIGGAMALPRAAWAQQRERIRRVGVLMGWSDDDAEYRSFYSAFIQELARLGWEEGRNLHIDQRWTNNDVNRAKAFAKELISLQPDVIFSGSTPATAAIQQETHSTPVIFAIVTDPVGSGFVAGLPRPGGNLTGFVHVEGSMAGKWLQMIKEVAPRVTRAVAMYNPDAAPFVEYFIGPFEAAAQALGVTPTTAAVRNDSEIQTTIDSLGREYGLILLPDSFLGGHRATIIAASTRNKVPAIFPTPTFAQDGGLLSYGPNFPDIFRRAAGYVNRILKGDKADDLPVQLPTKYDLVINLRTAKALGLTVPPTLLVFATEVIE